MGTRMRTKDLPKPWHASKRSSTGISRPKSSAPVLSAVENFGVQSVQGERKRRGRPSGKSSGKVVATQKGMKKTKPLPASAANILLGVSSTSVADVEELRRKRQKDAEALGRTVHIVLPHQRGRQRPTMMMEKSEGINAENDCRGQGNSLRSESPPQTSPTAALTEESPQRKKNHGTRLEELREDKETVPSRCPGKEPVEEYSCGSPQYGNEEGSRRHFRVHVSTDRDSESKHRSLQQQGRPTCVGPSPTEKKSREPYEGQRGERRVAQNGTMSAYRGGIDECLPGSPTRSLPIRSHVPEYWSDVRSESRSPTRQKGDRHEWSANHFQKYKEYPVPSTGRAGYHTSRGFHSREHGHHRQYDSSSPEDSRRHWRSRSREDGRISQPRKRSLHPSLSPTRRSFNSGDAISRQWSDSGVVKNEDIVDLSPSSDRRRRRHEQACMEAEKARRKNEGNKPFYLMLDREGKPYGLGKPAWITEINKLARGLDPSCTHIRKQTYEDVQTFKDRLDESFDYSGTLNQDYLRAMMGKAVTKRRGELIAMIKKNEDPPKYIDYEVWCRLEKLASSKQREEKSEQGRYANSCRRVVGRTGRRGTDGVREKLRSLFGRSPDPSEVEEEMHRDKGYGGHRRKKLLMTTKEERNYPEEKCVHEGTQFERSMRTSSSENCDASSDEGRNLQTGSVIEEEGRHAKVGGALWDEVAGTRDCIDRSSEDKEGYEFTKDDYIEKLEAKIKILQEEKAKASTSRAHPTLEKE